MRLFQLLYFTPIFLFALLTLNLFRLNRKNESYYPILFKILFIALISLLIYSIYCTYTIIVLESIPFPRLRTIKTKYESWYSIITIISILLLPSTIKAAFLTYQQINKEIKKIRNTKNSTTNPSDGYKTKKNYEDLLLTQNKPSEKIKPGINTDRKVENNISQIEQLPILAHKETRTIKRVYLGLPKHLKDKVLWVSPEFRTNSLSHEPGGSDIVVEYHDQNVYGYDRIKMPSRYVQKFWSEGISMIHENFNNLNDNDQLDVIRQKVKSLYARKYSENNYEVEEFKEIWNHKSSVYSPLEILKEFDQ
jgi:hypothetical protein